MRHIFVRRADGDGQVGAGDTLLTTLTTAADGTYSFEVSSKGDYVLNVDTASLPPGHAMTTDNVETASFSSMGFSDPGNFGERQTFVAFEAVTRLDRSDISKAPHRAFVLDNLIEQTRGTDRFLTLVDHFKVTSRYPEVLSAAQHNAENDTGVKAIRLLLQKQQMGLIRASLESEDTERAIKTARVLERARENRAVGALLVIEPEVVRQPPFKFGHSGKVTEINILVFHAVPEPFDIDIIQSPATAVHVGQNLAAEQPTSEVTAGELAVLISVEYTGMRSNRRAI